MFLDFYSKFPYNPYKPYKTTDAGEAPSCDALRTPFNTRSELDLADLKLLQEREGANSGVASPWSSIGESHGGSREPPLSSCASLTRDTGTADGSSAIAVASNTAYSVPK